MSPFFLPGLSHFPFLLSLSLSLSPSLSLMLFLLLSSFLVIFFLCVLVFFRALFLCFCFMQRRTSTYEILKVVLIIFLCFLGYLFLLSLSNPFWLSLLSPLATPHLNLPLFGVCVFFLGFLVAFLFCVGFVFVAFALFWVCIKTPNQGELAHSSPCSPPSKTSEVVVFDHKICNS